MKILQALNTAALGVLHIVAGAMFASEGNGMAAVAQALGGMMWLGVAVYQAR